LGVDSVGEDENLAQGEELREAPYQMVTGGVEQHTRSPFWGSKGEQEGQKKVLGGGEAELSGAGYSGRGGQGRRCSSILGKGRGGAGNQRRGLGRPESQGRRTAGRRWQAAVQLEVHESSRSSAGGRDAWGNDLSRPQRQRELAWGEWRWKQ
jgi:hypothetical protein